MKYKCDQSLIILHLHDKLKLILKYQNARVKVHVQSIGEKKLITHRSLHILQTVYLHVFTI